ncbi:MAG TPA: tetratricopeptide repeat protein, partial [Pyrinomonadaceae bacterium]
TIETLRDAGTETPSGRLVIDIERLRRSRAATQTGESGLTTSEEEAPDTAGRPAAPRAAAPSAAGASGVDAGASDARAGASAGSTPAGASDASPYVAGREVSHPDEGAAARVARRRGSRRDWKTRLTHPLAFVVIITAALLLVFGGVMLRRAQRGGGALGVAGPAGSGDEAEDALGRSVTTGDLAPRGSQVEQPRTAADFYENGSYFLSIRSYDAAVRDLRQAVALQPDFPAAHNRLGVALMRKGQFRAAAEEFRTAVDQRGGRYPTAHYNLGFVLQQQRENDEALAAYRAAAEASGGTYPDAHYQIGSILLETPGRAAEAAEAFRKAIEQNKGRDPEAHYRLGFALVQQKDFDGAEAAFREAIGQRGGDFAFAHYNLGLLYQQTGRVEEAIKEFETYLQQAPRDENRFRAENTLRDLRRRAAREGNRKQ